MPVVCGLSLTFQKPEKIGEKFKRREFHAPTSYNGEKVIQNRVDLLQRWKNGVGTGHIQRIVGKQVNREARYPK